ncbi:LytTR family DNA-binding domain-containing protein [Fulvivirgaceae bacterium BMA10]|uniref:LytTR family DNA-binding domain-containing protein n=1 Tax=Splendidivirga corallicola TaxID=3051826 RepID=A0ABT8KV50_9BACT|nr:LytTR family DNA-binding domain-containing protein [Fulvivirgaceae bacterium BMA10]
MMTAIAIDDEPKAIDVIRFHVSKIPTLSLIAHFHEPEEAMNFLRSNPVDLIFLDINMPYFSGLEMLQQLQIQPNVIFTTAYSEFALESYDYNAVDYLLKPFEFDRFKLAVDKAEERIESQRKQQLFFFIKDGFKNIKVRFDDILFIKGSGNYLDIQTDHKVYSPRMTFVEMLNQLPPSDFVRVHQSYIVNIHYIDKIEDNHIFIGSHKISISSSYREVFFKRLRIE